MPAIQWTNDLSVGVKTIDYQHQALIRIANDLIDALVEGKSAGLVEDTVRKLREYTVFHFNYEERLMEKIHYLLSVNGR